MHESRSYDVALICLSGHVITSSLASFPEDSESFCRKCGERTIDTCPNCNKPIRGRGYLNVQVTRHIGNSRPDPIYPRPNFCVYCGSCFPWTRKSIETAGELIEMASSLSPEERQEFLEDLENLAKDSPETTVATVRVPALLKKVGGTIAEGLKKIAVDLATEAAKRQIGW